MGLATLGYWEPWQKLFPQHSGKEAGCSRLSSEQEVGEVDTATARCVFKKFAFEMEANTSPGREVAEGVLELRKREKEICKFRERGGSRKERQREQEARPSIL